MSLSLMIYLADVLSSLKFLFCGIAVISAILMMIGIIMATERTDKESLGFCWATLVFSGVLGIIAILLPSKETSYAMIAAHSIEDIAQNERVQDLASNSLKLIEDKIKAHLGE